MSAEKIQTVMTKDELLNCIENSIQAVRKKIVVTIVANSDDEEIWCEAELNAKEVTSWIHELYKECKVILVHLAIEDEIGKSWHVVQEV